MSGNNKDTTAMILAAMKDLGPADARTIAEKADVGYSTAVRKLRDWTNNGEVTKVDRGADPAHYTLRNSAQALPSQVEPAPCEQPEPAHVNADDPAETACPPGDAQADALTGERTGADGDLGPACDPQPYNDINELTASEGEGGLISGGTIAQANADEQDAAPDEYDDPETGAVDGDTDPQSPDQTDDGAADEVVIPADPPTPAALAAEPETLPNSDDSTEQQADGTTPEVAASVRRPKRYFRTEGMAILRAHPDKAYTVADLQKLIVAKEIAAGAPATTTASSGAISNAMHKAAADGECLAAVHDKHVTFQAA